MKRIAAGSANAIVVLGLLAACSSAADVGGVADLTPGAANALVITAAKGSWDWEEVSQGIGLRASIRNSSTQSLKAVLGDGFNAATEQSDLFLAAESGAGAVEWRDASGAWQPVVLAYLVEGARAVTLRPGGTYALTTVLAGPRRRGRFRIRVDFFDAPAGTQRRWDYSPTFEIR